MPPTICDSTGRTFRVDADLARQSPLLRTTSTAPVVLPVPLPTAVWAHVLDWCAHHRHDPVPELEQELELEQAQPRELELKPEPEPEPEPELEPELEPRQKPRQKHTMVAIRPDAQNPAHLTAYQLCTCDYNITTLPSEELCGMLLAADQLQIPALLSLTSRALAARIKGKSAQEIRAAFAVKNDFGPDEELQLRKEDEWAED